MSGCSQPIEVDAGGKILALAFTPKGDYLVSGGNAGLQVWRVKDGERVATMPKIKVHCVAVSTDGRFIAAGSQSVLVWDTAKGYKQVFQVGYIVVNHIYDVDFSPYSSHLVSANGVGGTAIIWNIAACRSVHMLRHGNGHEVKAAKYSPQGDRIATATQHCVRVWDSEDGCLLLDVKLGLRQQRGLLWFDNHLFVKTDNSIVKEIDPFTGSTVSEWPVPGDSFVSQRENGQFMVYSTSGHVTFWDTSAHVRLGLVLRSNIYLMASSPDDRLAVVTEDQKIIIDHPFLICHEPDIYIESAVLYAWKNGRLTEANALLTAAPRSEDTAHHVLASRALVRARLRQWDAALLDADESVKFQSSIIGYIAKCVALIGRDGAHAACRVCEIASLLFHSDQVTILLLIKAIALFMAGEYEDAMSRIDDLIAVRPLNPMFYIVQAYMHLLRGNLYVESGDYGRAIESFDDARLKLGNHKGRPPLIILLISGWEFDDLAIVIQRRLCEALFVVHRIRDASENVLRMVGGGISMSESVKEWVSDFMQRCLSAPESNHIGSSIATDLDNTSQPMTSLLREWAKLRLSARSWRDTLASASSFMLHKCIIYQMICEHLEMIGRLEDAVACYHQMCREQVQEAGYEQENWIQNFKHRCHGKLEDLGDSAVGAGRCDEAVLRYTSALSLKPTTPQCLIGKRSKAFADKEEFEEALNDADEVINLDPASPLGYKRKHDALRGMGRHVDATNTFNVMLFKMSVSSDPDIRERFHKFMKMKETIRATINDTIHDTPPVLIDTVHGRLCDKFEQTSTFEKTSTFVELMSSETSHAHVEQEIGKYFRYATFSHKWEDNEPLFEKVLKIVVYDLDESPANEKLKVFCKIVREAGFAWAWSDTCCINKGDHFVLQEALVSMFKWYERSAMTAIFLRGVDRLAKRGALTRSIWNMRAWTVQEYHASKVVRIYTEDWTPYLGLDIYNHKESPEVTSEMEEATGVSAQALMALCPGLNDIREKLRLASTRQTTRVEDAAYSLLGIFSLPLPIIYGEGDKALGRLLAQLLTDSGETSILAWAGRSGSFNSCLPSSITVFNQLPSSHIPQAISDAEMVAITAGIRSFDLPTFTTLYDRVNELPVPSFSGRRMKLPCLIFNLGQPSIYLDGSEFVFRAQTNALGVVEIRTQEDLSQLGSLCLVNPWIDFLLDRELVKSVLEAISEEDPTLRELPLFPEPPNTTLTIQQTRTTPLMSRIRLPSGSRSILDATPLPPPATISPAERQTRVLQFIARLRQPFGALLLTPNRRNVEEYRRVAPESLITVQVEEITLEILMKLINSVRVLDVL